MENNITEFPGKYEIGMDISDLDRASLLEYQDIVQAEIDRLDRKEPRSMKSDAYEEWADRHEYLEDIRDDICDRLEEL